MGHGDWSASSSAVRVKNCLFNYRGILFAFVTACTSSVVVILVSLLQGSVDSSKLTFFRGSFSCVSSLIFLIYKNISIKPTSFHEVKFFALYGTSTSFAVLAQYYAYQNMPTGDATAILYSYIAFGVVFGRILLKEHLGLFEGLFVLLAIVGVLLIVRPSFLFGYGEESQESTFLPAVLAVLASVAGAFVAVALRALGKQNTHPMKSIHYCAICLLVLSSVSITIQGGWSLPICTKDRLLTVAFALASFLLLVFFACALAAESIVLVTVITVSEVWIVFFLDTFLLGTSANLLSILGILLIVGSSIAISAKKLYHLRKGSEECPNDEMTDHGVADNADSEEESCGFRVNDFPKQHCRSDAGNILCCSHCFYEQFKGNQH